MSFWKSMEHLADRTLESLGDEDGVIIGGRKMQGVVQPVELAVGVTLGGISEGVTHLIQVGRNDGDAIADGDVVECRLLQGRVVKKEHFGAGWMVQAGPKNRYKADEEF